MPNLKRTAITLTENARAHLISHGARLAPFKSLHCEIASANVALCTKLPHDRINDATCASTAFIMLQANLHTYDPVSMATKRGIVKIGKMQTGVLGYTNI